LAPDADRTVRGVTLLVEAKSAGRAALLVDAIQGQRQVVIKSLEANFQRVDGIAAATILGDGRVALILDIDAIVGARRVEQQPLIQSELRRKRARHERHCKYRRRQWAGANLVPHRRTGILRRHHGGAGNPRLDPSHPLPQAPNYVCGVINLRGAVLPIVDLSRALGWASPSLTYAT